MKRQVCGECNKIKDKIKSYKIIKDLVGATMIHVCEECDKYK